MQQYQSKFIRSTQLATLFISLGLLLVSSSPLLAQSLSKDGLEQASAELGEIKLTAIPARLGDKDYSLRSLPGGSVQTQVRVKNGSSVTQKIETVVEDFTVEDDGKQPIPLQQENPSGWKLADWITLTPSQMTLEPGQIGNVDVLIQTPADALPGGRYAMIMHQPRSITESDENSGSIISQKVGTLVYFQVEGEINQEAYIRDLENKTLFEFGPVPFSFSIDNRSDIHIHPNIEVELTNMLGKKSDQFRVVSKNIFPYSQRRFEASWDRRWGLGKYQAKITMSYGTTGKVASAFFSFWIVPIRLILLTVAGIVLFGLLSIFIKKKFERENQEKYQETQLLKQKLNKLHEQKFEAFKDENN